MTVRKYLAMLFDGWIGRISTALTAVLLLSGLLSQHLPLSPLESIPRDILILLAFVSFAVANFQIYRHEEKTPQLDIRLTDWEDPHIKGGFLKVEGREIWLEESFFISTECKAQISNPGAPTSTRLLVTEIVPECKISIASPADIEVDLYVPPKYPRQGRSSLERIENPCYLNQSQVLTVVLAFAVPIELEVVEQNCGAFANLPTLAGKMVLAYPNGRPLSRDFNIDLRSIHERIENEFTSKIHSLGLGNNRNHLPEAKEFLRVLKRYLSGKKE